MYKSLKISLHLTQNCIFTNWLQKKEIVKNHFFLQTGRNLRKLKNLFLTKQNFKILVVGSGNFRANFHFYYWRPKSYQKTTELNFQVKLKSLKYPQFYDKEKVHLGSRTRAAASFFNPPIQMTGNSSRVSHQPQKNNIVTLSRIR